MRPNPVLLLPAVALAQLLLAFLLLLLVVPCATRADVATGGAGLAALFSGSSESIAAGRVKLPENATGISFAYWAQFPSVLGSNAELLRDFKLVTFAFTNSASLRNRLSIGTAHSYYHTESDGSNASGGGDFFLDLGSTRFRISSPNNNNLLDPAPSCSNVSVPSTSIPFFSRNVSLAQRSTSPACARGWTLFTFSWDARTKALSASANGIRLPLAPVRYDARWSQAVFVRVFERRTNSCGLGSRTFGGYVPDGSACVFPFTFDKVQYNSACVSWQEAKPFYNAANVRNYPGVERTYWCATVPELTKNSQSWGYCDCVKNKRTVVEEVDLYASASGEAKRAGFSGPVAAHTVSSVFNYTTPCVLPQATTDQLPPPSARETVVIWMPSTNPNNCANSDGGYGLASEFARLGFKSIVFAEPRGTASRVRAQTSTTTTPTQQQGAALFADVLAFRTPLQPINAHAGVCSNDHRLFDGSLSTSWSGCELHARMHDEVAPLPTHYGFAVSSSWAGQGGARSWRLERRIRGNNWYVLDRQLERRVAPASYVVLPLSRWVPFEGDAQDGGIEIRVVFYNCTTSNSLAMSEFGIFSLPANYTGLASANNSHVLFGGKTTTTTTSSPSPLNAFVVSIAQDSPIVSALVKSPSNNKTSVRVEFFPMFQPRDAGFGLTNPGTLVLGQSPLAPNRFDAASSFTGLLDDVRVYPFALSQTDVTTLFTQDVSQLPSTSRNILNVRPHLHYTFDSPADPDDPFTCRDEGVAQQDLHFASTDDSMDSSIFRFEQAGARTAPRGAGAFVPSLTGRALPNKPLVMPVDNRSTQVLLTIPVLDSLMFGPKYWAVAVSVAPQSGSLRNITIYQAEGSQSVVVMAVYEKAAPATWVGDAFRFDVVEEEFIVPRTSMQVTLVPDIVVEPQPARQEFRVLSGSDVVFTIGGGFSSWNSPLEVVLDASSIHLGSLTLASNCSQSVVPPPQQQQFRFTGMAYLRYSAASLSPDNTNDAVESVSWWFAANPTGRRSVVQFTTAAVAHDFHVAYVEPTPRVTSITVDDNQAFIMRFAQSGSEANTFHLQVLKTPYLGQVFAYYGSLPSGLVANAASIPASDMGVAPITLQSPESIAQQDGFITAHVSQVLRASSQFAPSLLPEACEAFNSPACTSFSSLQNVVGASDDVDFRFSSPQAGHEFLEVRFPVQMRAFAMRIRQRSYGSGSLFRVSIANSRFVRDVRTCGGSQRTDATASSGGSNVTVPPVWAGKESCYGEGPSGNQVQSPLPITDCVIPAEYWSTAWETACPQQFGSRAFQDESYVETEIPLCTLGGDVFRLDFDTRLAFDPTSIDSISIVGYELDPSQVVRKSFGVGYTSLVYMPFPTGGIAGNDRVVVRAVTSQCVNSQETLKLAVQLKSSTKVFQTLDPAFIDNINRSVAINYTFMSAIDFIRETVFFAAPNSNTGVSWPPQATASWTMQFNGLSRSRSYAIATLPSNLQDTFSDLNVTTLSQNLSFVSFDFRLTQFLDSDYTPQREDTSASASFRFVSLLDVNCRSPVAFPLYGACSKYRLSSVLPVFPGKCARRSENEFRCDCSQVGDTGDPESDIVVAGPYCQYDTLTTCYGRGYPDSTGTCRCFDTREFGAKNCDKRAFNSFAVKDLEEELRNTYARFKKALAIAGYINVVVRTDEQYVRLVDLGDLPSESGDDSVLITLEIAKETNPDLSCNGHGIPSRVCEPACDVYNTECQCDLGYSPPKTCVNNTICDLGYYLTERGCVGCPVGSFCNNGVDARPCANGTFSIAGEPRFRCYEDCNSIGPNMYVVKDGVNASTLGVTCARCAQGNECDGVVQKPCEPGTMGTPQLICLACKDIGDGDRYSAEFRSQNCSVCPANSKRVGVGNATSVLECVCNSGFWNGIPEDSLRTGVACVPCPGNGICPGHEVFNASANAFQAVDGSEAIAASILSSSSLQARRALQTGNGTSRLPWRNASPYPDGGYWGDPAFPSAFFQCQSLGDFTPCLGGADFQCESGYAGRFCQLCASGFHSVGGFCVACPGGGGNYAVVVFGITLILVLFFILNRASNEVQALEIGLFYVQVCNLVQNFSFVWPNPVSVLQGPYTVSNFDIDFITSDCVSANQSWNYEDHFYVQWFFVWYVGAFMLLMNLAVRENVKYREKRRQKRLEIKRKESLAAAKQKIISQAARKANERLVRRRSTLGEVSIEVEGTGRAGAATPPPPLPGSLTNGPAVASDDASGGSNTGNADVLVGAAANSPPPTIPMTTSSVSDRSARKISRTFFSSAEETDITDNTNEAGLCCGCDFPPVREVCAFPCTRRDNCCTRLFRGGARRKAANEAKRVGMGDYFHDVEYEKTDPRLKAVMKYLAKYLRLPKNREQYETYANEQIGSFVNLVRVVYNSVVLVSLQSFECVELADGTSVMYWWPATPCGSPHQQALLALGIIGFTLYGVGYPAFVVWLLRRASANDLKAEEWHMQRYGFLYSGYTQKNYLWEVFVVLRRLLMCIILVAANGYPYIQAISGSIVLVVCLCAQVYRRPYLSEHINLLESVCLSSIFFYLLCGLVFTGINDFTFSTLSYVQNVPTFSEFQYALSWILLVVSLLTILMCFFFFYHDLRDFFNVLLTEKSLIHHADSEDVSLIRVLKDQHLKKGDLAGDAELGREIIEKIKGKRRANKQDGAASPPPSGGGPAPRLGKRSSTRGSQGSIAMEAISKRMFGERFSQRNSANSKKPSLFDVIDQDQSNVLSRQELIDYAVGLGLDVDEVNKQVDRIFDVFDEDKSGTVDMREFFELIESHKPKSEADDIELKDTIKAKYLIKWARNENLTAMDVANFFELDKAIRVAVADDAIVSEYRDNSTATFYRALSDAFPFLCDWLASARTQEVDTLRVILKELQECRDCVGMQGTFSRLTVDIDKAPVVFWLVNASEAERSIFREVYMSICNANNTQGKAPKPVWQRLKGGVHRFGPSDSIADGTYADDVLLPPKAGAEAVDDVEKGPAAAPAGSFSRRVMDVVDDDGDGAAGRGVVAKPLDRGNSNLSSLERGNSGLSSASSGGGSGGGAGLHPAASAFRKQKKRSIQFEDERRQMMLQEEEAERAAAVGASTTTPVVDDDGVGLPPAPTVAPASSSPAEEEKSAEDMMNLV